MLKRQVFITFLSLFIVSISGFAQGSFKQLEAQKKVDAIMSREIETGASVKNGGMSVYLKNGKHEYSCDFRIQGGNKTSSCESLDSVLPQIHFVSRRNFKFDGWYEGGLSYEMEFPDYRDIPKDIKKKGWYLTNELKTFKVKETYTEDHQDGEFTYQHRESGSDKMLYYFEDEANLLNPSKHDRKYDREQIYKGSYSSFYSNGVKRTRNKYEVEKNTFLRNNSLKSNVDCEVEVTIFGTYTKWYESGRKLYEVVYDETYMKHFIINEAKHQDESMEDGKLKGKYTAWHENGQILCKGELKNGKREGTWDFYDFNGVLVEKIKYLNGKIKGEYLSFFENGQKREKVIYYNDFKVGLGYEYHSNGKVHRKTEYVRGDKFGLFQEYDREGNIIINGYYNRNVRTDKWESYYANGKLREIRFFKEGLLHGLRNKFFPSGTKSFEVKYDENKEEGEFTTWFKNGIKDMWGKFHNGMKNGTWYKYYNSGNKKEFVNYALIDNNSDTSLSVWYEDFELRQEKHLRNGLWVRYHENGQKRFEGSFTNGRLDGQQTYFDSTGVVVRKEFYVAGQRKGDIQKYHKDGSLMMKGNYSDDVNLSIEAYFNKKGVQTIIAGKGEIETNPSGFRKVVQYVDGSPHGTWQQWYPSGELLEEGTYVRGEETGMYVQYHKDGTLSEEGEYVNGIEEGHWKHFSKSGTLVEKGKYLNGVKIGKWMYYYENGAPKEKVEYLKDDEVYVWDFWNPNGVQKVINGSGEYVDRDEAGVRIRGMIRKGRKEGTWKLANPDKEIDYLVVFKKGKKIR